jgi:signal transduction histidine kinase
MGGAVGTARPAGVALWVPGLVYAVVLLAGGYYAVAGLAEVGAGRLVGFVAGIGALYAVELLDRRRHGVRIRVALLVLRVGLFAAVAALDGSGLSRALFVLVPFTAYLSLGRSAGRALAVLALLALLAGYALWVPGWYGEAAYVSDLLMFGIGLVLAMAMAGIAVREQQARARLAASAERVAELSTLTERNRLAREIHDSLGHHLTAIAIQLEKAEAFGELDRPAAQQALADARWSARQALGEVRRSVRTLRSEPFSLRAALAELVGHAEGRSLTVTGEEDGTDPATLLALYRVAQEAVTNASRHGLASTVAVSVAFGPAGVELAVTDDGRGFDPPGAGGFGLVGMRERIALAGGQLEVRSAPGAGTSVLASVPAGRQRVGIAGAGAFSAPRSGASAEARE